MTRRCSHCSFDGHNSRTCPSRASSSAASNSSSATTNNGGGVRLFGVRLTDGSIMKKSASMGNLSSLAHYNSSTAASPNANPSSPSSDVIGNASAAANGYLSDDPAHVNRRTDRKKGTPWTEEEHRLFLIGLHKLGKGDWRGIARNYVITRTPTQVASHAQKYFIRQTNAGRRKRRTSLFDMSPDMDMDTGPAPEHFVLPQMSENDHEKYEPLATEDQESQPMEVTSEETVKEYDDSSVQASYIVPVPVPVFPAFYPAYVPVPFRFWSPNLAPTQEENPPESSNHQVLKPIPVIPRDPIDVDELVGMSHLSIKEKENEAADSNRLTQRLLGSPSRHSAFRPRRSASVPNLTQVIAEHNSTE